MQAASREALATARQRLDEHLAAASADDARALAEDLFGVTAVLVRERALRRLVADPATAEADRNRLADTVFGGKISDAAMQTVSGLVTARWSKSADLVDAAEALARRAQLAVAEADSSLEDVEDELFRFGRVLDREPRLTALLADRGAPADKRVSLLRDVLGGKTKPVTAALLEQAVRSARTGSLDLVAQELAELAAERRDRYVAHVRTPVALTPQQEQRLTEALSRLYGRSISLQIEPDPYLLGGLVVRVGDEVIDGSVAGRLAAARRNLPD
jgi:F-type H+-transporting ATPase subunit delta